MLVVCEELNIALVSWPPLGKGYLTGTIPPDTYFPDNDRRSSMLLFTHKVMKANWDLIELLQSIGERNNARTGQVNMAWLLGREPFIVPIPGTTKLHHVKKNMGALSVKFLNDELKYKSICQKAFHQKSEKNIPINRPSQTLIYREF